jgi:hypothetical protein
LPKGEAELGLGIHGEKGRERISLKTCDEHVKQVILTLLEAGKFEENSSVVVLVNNLGSTTNMEMSLVVRSALLLLEEKKIKVERVYNSSFMTSLDMTGFSISLLKTKNDAMILQALDAPTLASGWQQIFQGKLIPPSQKNSFYFQKKSLKNEIKFDHEMFWEKISENSPENSIDISPIIHRCCESILKHKELLNELDGQVY